jgi:hypothetical protein
MFELVDRLVGYVPARKKQICMADGWMVHDGHPECQKLSSGTRVVVPNTSHPSAMILGLTL